MIYPSRIASNFISASEQEIKKHIPKILPRVQKVYDEWDEEYKEVLGGGGICQDIADEIAGVLSESGLDAAVVSQAVGDQHVYTVTKTDSGVFRVDINPRIYEEGAGYHWEKIPGVKFDAGDIDIEFLDDDPSKYEEYIED